MSYRHVVGFIFVVLFYVSKFCSVQLPPEAASQQKFLGKYPIPRKTPGPLDIKSREAKKVTLSPIIFIAFTGERVYVINNGKSVESIIDQRFYQTKVTGGPLFNDTYKFEKFRFYWTNDTSKAVLTTVDGKNGAPLEVFVYFYNLKYGSFENALNYQNGLAEFSFRVRIGGLPNLRFIPFVGKLRAIQKAGSRIPSNLGQSFAWFDNYLPFTQYFAFPGEYTDDQTGKIYECATTLIFPNTARISEQQFKKTFLSLKDKNGEPLINAKKQVSNKAPIIQSRGVIQLILPIGANLLDIPL